MKKMFKTFVVFLKNVFYFIFSKGPVWVDIEGYENIYQISNNGDVYNIRDLKIVTTFIKKDGYECVALTDNQGNVKQHRVHRLVAKSFLENKDNKTIVKHIDGDKTNNNVKNLEWR